MPKQKRRPQKGRRFCVHTQTAQKAMSDFRTEAVHTQLLCMSRGTAMLSLCFGQDLQQ